MEGPRFLPLGISGVFNWRGIVGKATVPDGQRLNVKGPIPDLEEWERWHCNLRLPSKLWSRKPRPTQT